MSLQEGWLVIGTIMILGRIDALPRRTPLQHSPSSMLAWSR